MSAKDEGSEPTYYESDSPCRRCNGTTRYRNTIHKGKCADCVKGDEDERRGKNWMIASGMMNVARRPK